MVIEKFRQSSATLRGISHTETGEPCQDKIQYSCENGVYIVALADGAGSKSSSHFGAEVATAAVCEIITTHYLELITLCEHHENDSNSRLVDKIHSHIFSKLSKKASELSVQVSDLASTLMFFATNGETYIAGHIGDGVMCSWNCRSDYVDVLSFPQNGESANITFFLSDIDAQKNFRIFGGLRADICGVLLMSDGVGEMLLEKFGLMQSNTVNIFRNFSGETTLAYNKALENFLSNTIAKHSEDDLSLNLLLLDNLDLDSNNSKQLIDEFLNDLNSKSQLVRTSSNSCMAVPFLKRMKVDFCDIEETKAYLNSL